MLKGISPLVGPELLSTLYRMGHGDEIVLADAHFPGESHNTSVIRADGLKIDELLQGVLPLLALDSYVEHPVVMMAPVEGDEADEDLETAYLSIIRSHEGSNFKIAQEERFDFYKRAEKAFAVIMTGDTRKYANLILKKGVTGNI